MLFIFYFLYRLSGASPPQMRHANLPQPNTAHQQHQPLYILNHANITKLKSHKWVCKRSFTYLKIMYARVMEEPIETDAAAADGQPPHSFDWWPAFLRLAPTLQSPSPPTAEASSQFQLPKRFSCALVPNFVCQGVVLHSSRTCRQALSPKTWTART